MDFLIKPKLGPRRELEIGATRTYHGAHGFTKDGIVKSLGKNYVILEIDGHEYELDRTVVR